MEILVYGLINSLTLALLAMGFSLVYGVAGLPNFAHGALYVLGGYLAWLGLNPLGLGFFTSAVLSVLLTAFVAGLIHRLALSRIRGMGVAEIIASYAIGLAVLEGLRFWGLTGSTFTLPLLFEGRVKVLGMPLDYQRIVVVLTAGALFLVLWLLINHTRLGLAMRASAQDEWAALGLGMEPVRLTSLAMAIGAGFSAAAGLVLFPLGSIVAEAGYHALLMALAVCIVGGLGSLKGAFAAAVIIGFSQVATARLIGPHFQEVVALAAIILTLIARPGGIWGRERLLEERV